MIQFAKLPAVHHIGASERRDQARKEFARGDDPVEVFKRHERL